MFSYFSSFKAGVEKLILKKCFKNWIRMLWTTSQEVKLIDSLANGEEGKEIEKSKVRINGSVVTLCCRSEITVGTATTELATLNTMGKMKSSMSCT